MNRRDFTKTAALTLAASATRMIPTAFADHHAAKKDELSVHFFSKHLQFLDYSAMAEAVAQMGFDGVDLTVRPGGHVEPAKVMEELPKAVGAIKANGIACDMMVTSITKLDDEAKRVLETAASLGIKYYRLGYLNFPKDGPWHEALDSHRAELAKIASFNRSLGLHAAYQNHAGSRWVGAYIPDLAYVLRGMNSDHIGVQYDIRHAMVEGGTAWPLGLRYVKDFIKTAPIKDYQWTTVDGKAKAIHVPLGDGLVDFDGYFKQLRSYGITPKMSLHTEYELGGAEKGRREITMAKEDVLATIKKDLDFLREAWTKSA